MALVDSVLSSAAGTSILSCDLLYIPIKSRKHKMKEKGEDEDVHNAVSVHPRLPQQFDTSHPTSGLLKLQHAGILSGQSQLSSTWSFWTPSSGPL